MNILRSYFQVFVFFLACFFAYGPVYGQDTDTTHKSDAVKISALPADSVTKHKAAIHSPAKATLYSALLPGLGQAYNHKYWKIPIIYAGLGVFTYFIIYNQQHYNTYQSALTTRSNGGIDPYINTYSSDDLVTIRDYYHRNRDLSVIGVAVFYALNVIDAEVDAQMFTFNVDDDLSMRLLPGISPYAFCGSMNLVPSLSLVMKLK